MHSEDKKVINKKEEQKLISEENKNLKTFIDGVEYGVTNKGCIYYETLKGKQIIVCNFFMQLLKINNDLSDNRSYTFSIILQEGRAQKEITLNNYKLKDCKWIDDLLGIEYHLGEYAKYKNLKIYISNLIVENMPTLNKELIKDTISKIKEIKTIDTNKDYTLGKNFLLGLSRLLEEDYNEYIAPGKNNISMSDSSKSIGFKEITKGIEVYYLKLDRVIKKIRNFNDLFNEELKAKLSNNKGIYSQLAELGVLIANRKDGKVFATKSINTSSTSDNESKTARFFGLDVKKLNEFLEEYIENENIEFLEGVDCKNISDEISTIYQELSEKEIDDIYNKSIKKIFKEKDSINKLKYKNGFYDAVINQYYDIDSNKTDTKVEELFDEVKKGIDVNEINKKISLYVNEVSNKYIENKYEKVGVIKGLKIYIKQEILRKQLDEENLKVESKERSINNESDTVKTDKDDADEILKKFNII